MDPLSQLFSAYLEMVSNNITNAYVDSANVSVVSKTLTYKGTDIRFQHFLWQVKQTQQVSIYTNLKKQLLKKAMFTELYPSTTKCE